MTSEIDGRRHLPTLAYIGAVCFRCYKAESPDLRLSKCGKCLRVAYCSTECQKADWKRHKPFCNAWHKLLHDNDQTIAFDSSINSDMSPSALRLRLSKRVETESTYLQQLMGRPLTPVEKNILVWEPSCMACSVTDRLIKRHGLPNRAVKPCLGCAITFSCCEPHWDLIKEVHISTPSQDSVGEFAQCQMNQWLRENEAFSIRVSNNPDPTDPGPFRWFPKRIEEAYTPLQKKNWWDIKEPYIQLMDLDEKSSQKDKDVRFRAVTEALSIPLSILFVMEVLNNGDDDWKRRTTLTIHILGSPDYSVSNNEMYEEILHLVPGIKALKVVFVASGYRQLVPPTSINVVKPLAVCSSCEVIGKKLFNEFCDSTYHSFIQEKGYRFVKPDLCIVFHPRISPETSSGWTLTVELLKKRKVPTIVTAYTRPNAEAEYAFLDSLGVKFVDSLSLRLNPFGALTCRSEPHAVAGFIAANLWFSGAFKG
ncbi:hypothetical protein CPB83DRAFT_853654 [Crepidotus variabilis]|uniref:MYND-type domain-containing protein n=1 Tax=Crepidotus variabilis TaxID=179855 RepID=A0A9P6EGX4_9AGAR|nr:hypothetical protein CPB83DRAFT_853654 [Crepidotus variabilis]